MSGDFPKGDSEGPHIGLSGELILQRRYRRENDPENPTHGRERLGRHPSDRPSIVANGVVVILETFARHGYIG